MKKLIIVLVFFAVISPAFAQNNPRDTENMYYFNVPVERIFPSSMGYIVQYRTSLNTIGTIGIPNEWFSEAAGRAEMLRLPAGTNWPSMSIFYVDGEFSHIRLYVHRVKAHQTWSVIPQGADVSRHFSDSDSFNFQF